MYALSTQLLAAKISREHSSGRAGGSLSEPMSAYGFARLASWLRVRTPEEVRLALYKRSSSIEQALETGAIGLQDDLAQTLADRARDAVIVREALLIPSDFSLDDADTAMSLWQWQNEAVRAIGGEELPGVGKQGILSAWAEIHQYGKQASAALEEAQRRGDEDHALLEHDAELFRSLGRLARALQDEPAASP
jgi:hypothetical protein